MNEKLFREDSKLQIFQRGYVTSYVVIDLIVESRSVLYRAGCCTEDAQTGRVIFLLYIKRKGVSFTRLEKCADCNLRVLGRVDKQRRLHRRVTSIQRQTQKKICCRQQQSVKLSLKLKATYHCLKILSQLFSPL